MFFVLEKAFEEILMKSYTLLLALLLASSLTACALRETPSVVPLTDLSGSCGGKNCAVGEFCEDRFKGHAVDDQGRPLDRQKCIPLPDKCRIKPSCECVTRHVAAKRCSDENGRVRLNDYPY